MSLKGLLVFAALAALALGFVSISAAAEEGTTAGSANAGATLGGGASGEASAEAKPAEAGPEMGGRPNHRDFNIHLGGGALFGIKDDLGDAGIDDKGGQGFVGMDWVLGTSPLSFSILGGYNGFAKGENSGLTDISVGAGFLLRLFVDRKGALNEDGGNAAGDLWIDAHFAYHNYEREDHGGVNVGLGYEMSLYKDFNMGPYGRFIATPIGDGLNYMAFAVGLRMSLGAKTGPDDMDGDGIEDEVDQCPKDAEDKDGFEDEEGCPDPDNDKDGIADADDKCPIVAGIPENAGCPEDDNDHDGIKNDVDKCPDEAEDKDAFEDEDGCPDLDNDKDGIADAEDKCPLEAEDKDGFEDADGCPDADNDKDGIADAEDKCPNEPETKNDVEDEDGCPDLVRVVGDQIKILQKVYFATNKDTILERSFPVLEEVAKVIALKPEIRVRVEGHTDDVGNDKKNLDLSKRRAASVKKFLVEHGVEEARLDSDGFGESRPIAENKTEDGRAENRRVEFYIIGAPSESLAPAAPAEPTTAPAEPVAPAAAPAPAGQPTS